MILMCVAACSGKQSTSHPARLHVVVRGHVLEVEVAADAASIDRGLMYRQEMAEGGGMLFVFKADEKLSFCMRDTPLPLSIAFLDSRGRIINIEDMEPFDVSSHLSEGPARYALEVHKGWFARRGIAPGDQCEFSLPENIVAY
jgi:uncharacterized membrane protein (UPF0127 family)